MADGKTIKQKADEEAARVEAEEAAEQGASETPAEPDEPANPDAEPDERDEAEEAEEDEAAEEAQASKDSGRSDKQTQAMFNRAVAAFRAKLADVFEVDDVQPSEIPGVIGFLLPGFTEQKTHDNFTRCQTCNGYGHVLTGSIKAGDETRPCPDPRCKGRGYWEKAQAPAPTPAPALAAVTGPTVYEQPTANGHGEYAEAPAWMGDPSLSAPTAP